MATHIALNNLGISRDKEFAIGSAVCTVGVGLGCLMLVGLLAATKGLVITAVVLGVVGGAMMLHAHSRPKTTEPGASVPIPTVQVIQIGNVRLGTLPEEENDDDSLERAQARRFLAQAREDLIAARCCLAQ